MVKEHNNIVYFINDDDGVSSVVDYYAYINNQRVKNISICIDNASEWIFVYGDEDSAEYKLVLESWREYIKDFGIDHYDTNYDAEWAE